MLYFEYLIKAFLSSHLFPESALSVLFLPAYSPSRNSFNFSTFVDNDSRCGLLESQSLKNAAVSLCRLKVGCFSSSSLDATKHAVFEIF